MKMRFWINCLILLLFVGVSRIEAQEKFRFPIGESSKTLSYGPLWVAAKMGFFEKEGLDVPIVTMRGSPLTIQALTADSIYVASATVDTLINAYERGADITMIGGLINGLGLSMIGAKQYKTYADLRGTTIGSQTLTSGTGFALRLVMKVHGLEYPRDYKLLIRRSVKERSVVARIEVSWFTTSRISGSTLNAP
ncbi:MAG: ABC transporter substrate-binding protein, partial [Candidatus Binatia bacterium]